MIKKLTITLTFMLLSTALHLMYGSSQTSKYHYLIQTNLMSDYLPDWMILDQNIILHGVESDGTYHKKTTFSFDGTIQPYGNFTGIWHTWYSDGSLRSSTTYLNGFKVGKFLTWHNNGKKSKEGYFLRGSGTEIILWDNKQKRFTFKVDYIKDDHHFSWHWNGNLKSHEIYKMGKLLSAKYWDVFGVKKVSSTTTLTISDFH